LHDYRHGERHGRGNVIMPKIAYSMTEDDIKAVASSFRASRQNERVAVRLIRPEH